MTRHRIALLILTLLFAAALAGCASSTPEAATSAPTASEASASDLTTVQLSLVYIPDVQFTPWYVGIEKGIFAEHGLDVIIEHWQETDSAKLLATGESDFAVLSGEQVLLAREQELPLVYVYEWYQQFPVGVAAKSGMGITSPADLAGHSVGTPVKEGASYIGLEALLASAGLTDEDIDLQTTGYAQVETLLTDQVDAVVIYIANEPVQLEAAGADVTVLPVSDYADLVSNGIITSEDMIENNPALVEEVVAAFDAALQYTIDHPDESFEIAQKYVEGLSDPDTAASARIVLDNSIKLWQGDQPGYTDPTSWEAMQQVLIDSGLLDAPLDLEQAYTNDYLPQ